MAGQERATFAWSELPKDVQYRVLSCLAIREMCRMRCVCKEWRDMVHRREFRSVYDMGNGGSTRSPSPVICYMESAYPMRLEWAAYDYAGRAWKRMSSVPGLPQSILTQFSVRRYCSLSSVGGLLCLYFWKEEKGARNSSHSGASSWTVWHPFRNLWKRLPPCKHRVSDRALVFVHAFVSDERAKTYKILMAHHPTSHGYRVHEEDRRLVTEIYDSGTGLWADAAAHTLQLSQSFPMYPHVGLIRRGVCCDGVVYFLTGAHSSRSQNSLLSYDISRDRWHEESYGSRYPIFEWDGRLMSIISRSSEPDEFSRMRRAYFFVEMDPATRRWEDTDIEIPWVKILSKFRDMESLAIVASGNHLALAGSVIDGGFKIAVYRRAENYWRLPPSGAFSNLMERSRAEGLILHTPLLDWKP